MLMLILVRKGGYDRDQYHLCRCDIWFWQNESMRTSQTGLETFCQTAFY